MKTALTTALVVLASAAAQKTQTIYINGQPVQAVSVSVGGKPALQILTSDLQKTGALTQGGNKPVDAIQGCKGQTLFNGVLRVTLLDAGLKEGQYQATFQVANGTNKTVTLLSDTDFTYQSTWAASASGEAAKFSYWDDKNSPNRDLLPGARATVTFLTNTSENPTFQPTRILWRPDPKQADPKLPWAKVRDMEFKLECK